MIETLTSTAPVENPEVLRVTKREIDPADYRHPKAHTGVRSSGYRNASVADVSRKLLGNWLIYDEEREAVVIAYLRINEDISPAVEVLNRVRITPSSRYDGTPTLNRTVGYLERNPLRQRDFCTMSKLAEEDPQAHDTILHYAQLATPYYADLRPDLYERHLGLAEKVLNEYRIEGSPFTSGILNRDNVLPYHFDSGNFQEVWSLMLGWKRDIGPDEEGNAGELVVPEYDIALGVEDNTLTAFDGQVALHGVSPFRKTSRYAYRYTLVAYSKVKMWACLTLDEEIARAKEQRMEKEKRRWAHWKPGQEPDPDRNTQNKGRTVRVDIPFMSPRVEPIHGVTPSVWANDQLNRLERLERELAHSQLTLTEIERCERSLARLHAANIDRLADLAVDEEQAAWPPAPLAEGAPRA